MRDKSRLVSGKGYSGINEEIIWISIGMGITIAILITIALCYIAPRRHQESFSVQPCQGVNHGLTTSPSEFSHGLTTEKAPKARKFQAEYE
ncbi:Uncharacterized protein DBV15_11592 [Temnothorax longispinosus]|uniref:Uncharacterized protein n=1 Tax=Temnothorax longispinosus TaxID=300112 RepID=A0A4S2KKP8_9HYME|nr:Uncharacterized protein DBV15_11592 [Temnothorax longispinosus]